jgi:hypothetical protein
MCEEERGATTYKRFCSLGWNCEPGLFLRSAGYAETRDFFKWSATPFEAMYQSILADFADTYDRDNLSINGVMIVDSKYCAATHKPSLERLALLERDNSPDCLFAHVDQDKKERGKLFLDEIRSAFPIAYLVAYIGDDGRRDAARLRQLLKDKGHTWTRS